MFLILYSTLRLINSILVTKANNAPNNCDEPDVT
jgi:hypothetical protein